MTFTLMVTLSSPCETDNLSAASSPSVLAMFPVAGQPVVIQPVETSRAVWRIGHHCALHRNQSFKVGAVGAAAHSFAQVTHCSQLSKRS